LNIRRIAENYHYTPQQVGDLTLDQFWALSAEEKELKRRRRTITGTPDELRAAGLLEGEGTTLYDLLNPPTSPVSKREKRRRREQAIRVARAGE
jgi:hypothetical protein